MTSEQPGTGRAAPDATNPAGYLIGAGRGAVPASGGSRIRTLVGIRRRIYSPLPLAARATRLRPDTPAVCHNTQDVTPSGTGPWWGGGSGPGPMRYKRRRCRVRTVPSGARLVLQAGRRMSMAEASPMRCAAVGRGSRSLPARLSSHR